jgi:hypothetical protein
LSAHEDGKSRKTKFAYSLILVIAVITVIAAALISVRTKTDYRVQCTASQYAIYSTTYATNNSTTYTTTRFAGVTTYTTTTVVSAPPGFVTIQITTQRSVSGAVAAGGEATCTYLSR